MLIEASYKVQVQVWILPSTTKLAMNWAGSVWPLMK